MGRTGDTAKEVRGRGTDWRELHGTRRSRTAGRSERATLEPGNFRDKAIQQLIVEWNKEMWMIVPTVVTSDEVTRKQAHTDLTAKMSSTPSKSSSATASPPPVLLLVEEDPKSLIRFRRVVPVVGLVGSELRDRLDEDDFLFPLSSSDLLPDSVWPQEQLSSSALRTTRRKKEKEGRREVIRNGALLKGTRE
ncbi:hypothetical protein HPB51_017286 [Rhipicephalus microplus]|uniref:Uncharacterized protein n=1 Tax=Rhipicephalus microplus TaxID=6941 RepID=A0A9J6EU19_RHIMP|nr:hypothetical protein HPB51_017286 [Rhipicephalus microplus]